MTDLPTRIERGEATDAEVATALGLGPTIYNGDWVGEAPPPEDVTYWPELTTCLTTLAKECERRGLRYSMSDWWSGGAPLLQARRSVLVVHPVTRMGAHGQSDGTYTGDCRALCAALVRAAQETSDA